MEMRREQKRERDESPKEERYPCVCCGSLTMEEQPPGTYQVCPVCGWEDDKAQYRDPDYAGGANEMSLNQAKEVWFRTVKQKDSDSRL